MVTRKIHVVVGLAPFTDPDAIDRLIRSRASLRADPVNVTASLCHHCFPDPSLKWHMATDHGTCVRRKDFQGLLDAESATRRPETLVLSPLTVINRVQAHIHITANPRAHL